MANVTRFARGTNAGTKVCLDCGKRTWIAKGNEALCEPCYEAAGLDNEHSDGAHDDAPNAACPRCQPAVGA